MLAFVYWKDKKMKFSTEIPIKICLILVILPSVAYGTLTPKSKNDKKTPKTKELKVKVTPDNLNVFDRNLIEEEPVANDILVENQAYCKDTKTRRFNGTVLGYVTPVSWG
jgi:hypothetical protein